jgi:hypothetical protein
MVLINVINRPITSGTKPGHYLLKLLVPPPVAGSIIGRGGAQIKELQLTYDVRLSAYSFVCLCVCL